MLKNYPVYTMQVQFKYFISKHKMNMHVIILLKANILYTTEMWDVKFERSTAHTYYEICAHSGKLDTHTRSPKVLGLRWLSGVGASGILATLSPA